MDIRSYLDYVAAFNGQDWPRIFKDFYDPDIVARFPVVELTGCDEVYAWYVKAHESLFEVLVPKTVEIADGGASLVADLAVHFVLLESTPYSPAGPNGKAGDTLEIPMRAVYALNERDLVTSLDVSFTGPPSQARISDTALPA